MPAQRLLSAWAQAQSHQGARVGRLVFDDAHEAHTARSETLSLQGEVQLVAGHEHHGVRAVGHGAIDDGLVRGVDDHGGQETQR